MNNPAGRLTRLFSELDSSIGVFKRKSGLRCPKACGHCCEKKTIEATVFEFLPLAEYLHRKNKAECWLKRLERTKSPACVFYRKDLRKKDKGHCAFYARRGFICRAFGFTASSDKYGGKRLIACSIMKKRMPEKIRAVSELVASNKIKAPSMTAYFSRMAFLAGKPALERMPINWAIKEAIEKAGLRVSLWGQSPKGHPFSTDKRCLRHGKEKGRAINNFSNAVLSKNYF